jgi:hypothetical protein
MLDGDHDNTYCVNGFIRMRVEGLLFITIENSVKSRRVRQAEDPKADK